MKKAIIDFLIILSDTLLTVIIGGCLGYGFYVRFANADFTETQLFLKIWYLMPILILSVFLKLLITHKKANS